MKGKRSQGRRISRPARPRARASRGASLPLAPEEGGPQARTSKPLLLPLSLTPPASPACAGELSTSNGGGAEPARKISVEEGESTRRPRTARPPGVCRAVSGFLFEDAGRVHIVLSLPAAALASCLTRARVRPRRERGVVDDPAFETFFREELGFQVQLDQVGEVAEEPRRLHKDHLKESYVQWCQRARKIPHMDRLYRALRAYLHATWPREYAALRRYACGLDEEGLKGRITDGYLRGYFFRGLVLVRRPDLDARRASEGPSLPFGAVR